MRIWFDTEFIEDGRMIDLISIGAVREDGLLFYAENSECDLSRASDWVRENVVSRLGLVEHRRPRSEIARRFLKFAGEKPEFWAYYADYDWVLLCQLYGTMMDLPEGWPKFCLDVKQFCVSLANPELPKQESEEEHHALRDALRDALWTRLAFTYLQLFDRESRAT